MNLTEIDENIKNVFGYLDTIDLSEYINKYKNKTVRELMNTLNNEFPYVDKYSVTLFDGVAEDEFVEYLNGKYHLNIRESVTINYYI